MHEISITQQMVDLVLQEAQKSGATKVRQINLVIGEMATVIDDCVRFYFEFISKGTLAEGAALNFRKMPLSARCNGCRMVFAPANQDWRCPKCRKWDAEIISGKEFYLDSLEIE